MRSALFLACVTAVLGCTTTTVKRNPGPHDRGIRYYRPKPYLLLQPTLGKSDDFVTISLEYLPDFTEEYSIHVRAGLGVNETSVTLKDGWNLTQINMKLDSQFDENINAVANLAKAATGQAVKTADDQPPATRLVVRANNVPLGYYESIVSEGPDGKKRLYGWRYVGFAPFNQCPTEMQGAGCQPCDGSVLFGLVMRDGAMTFAPIGEIPPAADLRRAAVKSADAPSPVPGLDQIIRDNEAALKKIATDAARSVLSSATSVVVPTAVNITPDPNPPFAVFAITLPAGTVVRDPANSPAAIAQAIEQSIRSRIAGAGNAIKAKVTLTVATQ